MWYNRRLGRLHGSEEGRAVDMGYYLYDMIRDYIDYGNTRDIFEDCVTGIAMAIARERTIKMLGESLEHIRTLNEDDHGVDGVEIIRETEESLYNYYETELTKVVKRFREEANG